MAKSASPSMADLHRASEDFLFEPTATETIWSGGALHKAASSQKPTSRAPQLAPLISVLIMSAVGTVASAGQKTNLAGRAQPQPWRHFAQVSDAEPREK
jgi:hypothetical protein